MTDVAPVTPHRLAQVRQLSLDARLRAAADVLTEGRQIKPSKQMVATVFGVSISGIDRALNGNRKRRPKMSPETLAAINDLCQEIYFLAGTYERSKLIAFAHYLGQWMTDHPEIKHLDAIGPTAALIATSVNALAALVDAIAAHIE